MKTKFLLLTAILLLFSNCAVIRPGEAGVKQTLGKFSDDVITEGTVIYNPFISKIIKESTQTNNIKLVLSLPSKEGLSVDSEISILYRLEQNKIPSVLENLGQEYEDIITSVFRSASSDVCAKFYAKDMHSGMRSTIEEEIKIKMEENLLKQAEGIELIAVLMKSIRLPRGLANSIEEKLQAEQDAMRMEFVIQQAKLEAERKIIDAEGERDAQIILATGLTPEIIKIKSIDAFNRLSASPNSKIIITDGKTPMLINPNE
ncbi:prohibitin family protein [Subsaximicrobium wynnwilliamsii]|jgi:regulator of protease activity HflC (stomatin/prohibitin superfamily)|uniref:Prohibitin family protein n=1 Tax=Subsaximicrobium wynnwilliamsii TaxID=291179 RepID=A0A5C6ZGD4_9FLAO|nr:prohibitin family protein [Subsaximicrobium wynnwilliamsii]TXD83154.1 prohibitin family protein [Subsaximicrobium wynnwilliamsii]TXD88267.1 prohibitin family protein [Subsaximicrobium wynnwilliamsii]TXE02988.1 prohibitin family protein [Subsaximicrobium wynnwilliamsii]